ncbi:MAG: hypothetical protein JXP34_02380 [Planctomycetes bacterium]|nr:hypothetical protein [Planctomycetota bacterium]
METTIFILLACALSAGAPGPNESLPAPDSFDAAAFGRPIAIDGGGRGLQWDQARDLRVVQVVFARVPAPEAAIRLRYWFSKWPNEGQGGWKLLDDPFNGKWLEPRADLARAGTVLTWRFLPLSPDENPEIDPRRLSDPAHATAPFRRTLKIRIDADGGPLPPIEEIRAFGSARLRETVLDIRWTTTAEDAGRRDGHVEVFNGRLLAIESLPPPQDVDIVQPCGWVSPRVAGTKGVRIRVLAGEDADPLSADLGIIRINSDAARASILVRDVVTLWAVHVRDIGVRVELPSAVPFIMEPVPQTIRERVLAAPEQTLERAMREITPKPPRPVPLGAPWARQEIDVGVTGDWVMRGGRRGSLRTPGRDFGRTPWDRAESVTAISTLPEPVFPPEKNRDATRILKDGVLPVIEVAWRTGEIAFHEEAFATYLDGEIEREEGRTGEEPVVLCAGLRVRNEAAEARRADVWLRILADPDLALDEGGIVRIATPPPKPAPEEGLAAIWLRAASDGGQWKIEERPRPLLHWTCEIPAGGERRISVVDPFIELLDAKEIARLRAFDFETERENVIAFWRRELARGMRIEIPDKLIQEFYDSNLWRIRISTDRDPDTGLLIHGAATYAYALFPNETCFVARSLEMRGLHREAALLLEPVVHWQGSLDLPGNFRSKEGLLYGAGPYTAQGYNMHHGFALWALAEHFRWSRDRSHLERIAENLAEACRWIARERRATFRADGEGRRVPEFGLAPAGDLEDVAEYQYWFSTNGYYHLGLAEAARALAEVGHPEAEGFAREAALYREHIRRSLARAIEAAPVVRLRDLSFVPYVPPRIHALRHLKEGWIREALYPSLHLATTGVLDPRSREIAWLLDDLEDNILPSAESGFGIDIEKEWFSRGGITLQPTLLDMPIVYLLRDEIPCYVRILYNAFAMSIYPDVRCFCEWSRTFGHGGGPVYKTPDESKFVQWLRSGLVLEEGSTLWIAKGTPRAWLEDGRRIRVADAATFFGSISFEIASEAGAARIRARIEGPDRDPPAEIRLRLRHPRGERMTAVTIDGASWDRFDPAGEWIGVPAEKARRGVDVTAIYGRGGQEDR